MDIYMNTSNLMVYYRILYHGQRHKTIIEESDDKIKN